MKKFVMLTVVALLVRPAYCAVTARLSLDCREGAKIADTTHPLIYDASWYAGGVTSKITANGQEIVSGTTGTCEWMPSTDVVNLLTLNVYNDSDEIVGTESVFYLSREDLTELEIPEGTTEIGDYTFAGGRFTSAMIPSSVTSIGDGAFFNCSRLISISVDEGNASYCSVDGVLYDKAKKELICHPARKSGYMAIPEGVTSIVDYAFYGCSGLTSVTIPSRVTRIGESAFSGCDGLEKVYVFAGDVKRVKELLVASGSELDVDSLTFVEEGKPYKDTVDGIEWTFTISKGKAVLYGHYERVNKQSVVTTTISSATEGEVTIPATLGGCPVTSIGDYAFYGCSGLTSVTIPEGVTSIGRLAFFYCGGLVSLTIPEGVTNIGNSAFEQCDNLREVIIPSSVIDMGEGAFWGCTALQSIAIPSGVGVIRQETFYNCISLCSIILHEGLREIGEYAFVHCDSLEMITFPSTLSAVTDGMFSGCERLRAVYYCSVIPPSVMLGSGYGYYRGLYDGASTSLLSIVPWMPSGDEWQGRQWLQWTPPPGGTGTGDDEEQSCVVVFDANGGSCSISSNQYVIGEELGELPDATREGYAFEGWFTEATGGEQVTAATVVTEDVTFYAQWSAEIIAMPVVDPPNGTVFRADDCLVTITTETDGAAIYYRVGAAPKASSKFLYSAPFTIVDTSTIYTYAMKEGRSSATNVVTITKGEVLTFAEAASAEGITTFITDGDAEWIAEEDANAKVGNASVRSGEIDDDQISWFTAEVEGPGTLSFWWRASCEEDELQEFDHLVFAVDDVVEGEVARLDGITAWEQITTTVSAGTHTLYWAYVKDESDFDGEDCGWVDGIVWTPSAAPVVAPTIEGDEGATVTGDADAGFVVRPSEGKTEVEVSIPQGVDAAKVTVEVSVKVASVKPNGAKVKIVSGGADITELLNVPAADGNGVIDLTKATVKEEIVKEVLDIEKGAVIDLLGGSQGTASPTITTAPTRAGLFYQFREGETLGGMKNGDSKVGDGKAWTPNITVKGGKSAFYSIGVGTARKEH